MQRLLRLLLSLSASLTLVGCGAYAGYAPPPPVANTSAPVAAQETIVPNRLVVFYRNGVVPANAGALAARANVEVVSHMTALGLTSVQVDGNTDAAIASLLANPEVTTVLHDRYVTTDRLQIQQAIAADNQAVKPDSTTVAFPPLPETPRLSSTIARPIAGPGDHVYYDSPQGWATRIAGGYGNNVPGGPASGPWNISMGTGIRIAILDSGVDPAHPGIAPNLILNLSEINQTSLPSPCDDGSPVDQTGHGTFTASLAAAAQGPGTGLVIGVAPKASLLNIKVVERVPSNTSGTTLAQCEAGTGSGLLSWVLQGIQDAIDNHAQIISASLGTLIDTTTGDGAGWVAQMNAVTYAASHAGIVIVAAAGNDSTNLTNSKYIDLPAQARNVLAVTASTNPACAENLSSGATCSAGPVTRTYYSNYGTSLDAIAAPGGSEPGGSLSGVTGFVRGACAAGLLNTTDGLPATPGQSLGCFNLGHVRYVQAVGTSASAPLVAGAAAVLMAAHPAWTPAQVISALRSTATPTASMAEPELDLPAALALN